MEWYWVLILCFIASGTGLFIGCMCRVAGSADERAGLKPIEEYETIGGIYQPGTLVHYQESQEDEPTPVIRVEPAISINKNDLESHITSLWILPQYTNNAKVAINLISMIHKAKRKKFRWKNYYKALFMGRAANGRKRSKAG